MNAEEQLQRTTLKDLAHFTPKQYEALESVKKFKFTLYGGAMGGGKSYFLRWVSLYLLIKWFQEYQIEGIRIGLFCEDYPTLKDRHLNKLEYEFPGWMGTMNKSDYDYKLSEELGGGVICFRNLDNPGKYASSEFAAILVDELTKNTKDRFDWLRTRMRWPGINDTKFIAGSNPGSIGHEWVKKTWILKEFEEGEVEAAQFNLVRALAKDNPHLSEGYFQTLEGLPEEMKKAYLEGDWNLFQGQFFSEWRERKHVIPAYNPPDGFLKYRSIDFGRTAPFCCKWYFVDYDGNVKVYREYYQAGVDADINFKKVKELSGDEVYQWTVLDAAAFATTVGAAFNRGAGETIADIAWKNGVECIPSPKNRKAGWTLLHQYLRWNEYDTQTKEWREKTPKIQYMSCCHDSIRTIPALVTDKHDNEDLDTKGEDHAADTDSYFLQTLAEGKSEERKEEDTPRRTWSQRFTNASNNKRSVLESFLT